MCKTTIDGRDFECVAVLSCTVGSDAPVRLLQEVDEEGNLRRKFFKHYVLDERDLRLLDDIVSLEELVRGRESDLPRAVEDLRRLKAIRDVRVRSGLVEVSERNFKQALKPGRGQYPVYSLVEAGK